MAEQPALTIYTGTSCIDEIGSGGWAAIVASGAVRLERSGAARDTSNDGLELRAVIAGMVALPGPGAVEIVTRNQRLAQALAGHLAAWQGRGWRTSSGRPLRHEALWRRLAVLLQAREVRCALSRDRGGRGLSEQARRLAARAARATLPAMGRTA